MALVKVEAGGGEVFSGGSREDVEWNGTLKNIAKRGEAAGGETDVDDLSRDGEYTAAETDAMHAQAIADERRQRDAEEEEREGIRTAAAKFKGYAPANVSAMSRGMHFKRGCSGGGRFWDGLDWGRGTVVAGAGG